MKCSFCGGAVSAGRGKMFVSNDGRISYFCTPKCEKNFRLKREGKFFKWTQKFERGKK